VFCILEVIINAMEHVPEFWTLWVGRILGGISTSLLFTAFESWMITEHRKRGFPEELLESTFGYSSAGFGITAILAGLMAQVSADVSGDIGPFQLAIFLTIVVMILVFFWPENTGTEADAEDSGLDNIKKSIVVSTKAIYRNPGMLCLGLSQAFFEGGMYSFVFMWVPSLLTITGGDIPTGLLFSCLMLAMTFGGTFASVQLNLFHWLFPNVEITGAVCILMQILAAGSMAVPAFVSFEFWPVFISFLVFEATVGMFNNVGGMLRSKYYPDKIQSSVMSVFRIPLNALVVIGTTLAGAANSAEELQWVFSIVVGMQGAALLLQLFMQLFFPPPKDAEALNLIALELLSESSTVTEKKAEKAAAKDGSPSMKMKSAASKDRSKSPAAKKMKSPSRSGSRSPKKTQ